MQDYTDYEPAKPNRRASQERKTHSIVAGAPVASGEHTESRRERDRRRNRAQRRALKG